MEVMRLKGRETMGTRSVPAGPAKKEHKHCVVCMAFFAGPEGFFDQGKTPLEACKIATECNGTGGRKYCTKDVHVSPRLASSLVRLSN